MWQSGTGPLDWATGVVLPLFKKGGKRVCSSYRGIALHSLPGKVYASVLERRIWLTVKPQIQEDVISSEIFSHEEFLRSQIFPVTYKEYQMVINAIPSGILQLIKGPSERQETKKVDFTFFNNCINIMSHHCNNKH